MLSEIIEFIINGIGLCFNLTKNLILDRVGNVNITYFHFIVFVIFMTIVIRLIGFIKGIQEVKEEREESYKKGQEKAYNEWLKDHPSTPRRFRK